jgi:hypothetical protein
MSATESVTESTAWQAMAANKIAGGNRASNSDSKIAGGNSNSDTGEDNNDNANDNNGISNSINKSVFLKPSINALRKQWEADYRFFRGLLQDAGTIPGIGMPANLLETKSETKSGEYEYSQYAESRATNFGSSDDAQDNNQDSFLDQESFLDLDFRWGLSAEEDSTLKLEMTERLR